MKNTFRLLLAVMGIMNAVTAFAVDYKVEVDHRLQDLLNISSNTASVNGNEACLKRYSGLYKDGVLNVALGFGYWDNSPGEFVFDSYIANGLRLALLAPCSPGVNVCGFKRQGDVFKKTVKGPDGKPNQFTVSISYGSISSNNVENTTVNKAKQYAHCEAQTAKYFREVANGSEVVMYIGHARDGGGPDFCPPVRDEHKKTNYPWYQKHRPGFNRLLSSMQASKAAGQPNQIVGLYSCYSRKHFQREMGAVSPSSGFVLTDIDISSINAINSLVTTLDAAIAQKCGTGFSEGLKLSNGVSIFGMFPKN